MIQNRLERVIFYAQGEKNSQNTPGEFMTINGKIRGCGQLAGQCNKNNKFNISMNILQ